jgi:hypothetical protein
MTNEQWEDLEWEFLTTLEKWAFIDICLRDGTPPLGKAQLAVYERVDGLAQATLALPYLEAASRASVDAADCLVVAKERAELARRSWLKAEAVRRGLGVKGSHDVAK